METLLNSIGSHYLAFGAGLLLGIFFGVWLIGLSVGKFGPGDRYCGKQPSNE